MNNVSWILAIVSFFPMIVSIPSKMRLLLSSVFLTSFLQALKSFDNNTVPSETRFSNVLDSVPLDLRLNFRTLKRSCILMRGLSYSTDKCISLPKKYSFACLAILPIWSAFITTAVYWAYVSYILKKRFITSGSHNALSLSPDFRSARSWLRLATTRNLRNCPATVASCKNLF